MSIPLVKLGYLLVRTFAKPIAKMVQDQAAAHPMFRGICIKLSQSYHLMEIRLKSRLNKSSDSQSNSNIQEHIKPLSDEKAIQFGANFIGEFVIFSIAGVALILESLRNSANERKKQAERDGKVEELYKSIEIIKERLNSLSINK